MNRTYQTSHNLNNEYARINEMYKEKSSLTCPDRNNLLKLKKYFCGYFCINTLGKIKSLF